MSEMVERVARVLCALWGVDPDDMRGGTYDGGSYARGDAAWHNWTDEARAAIAAMREPTGEMKDAGAETYGVGNGVIGPTGSVLVGQPTKAYQAMIDAALGEGSR